MSAKWGMTSNSKKKNNASLPLTRKKKLSYHFGERLPTTGRRGEVALKASGLVEVVPKYLPKYGKNVNSSVLEAACMTLMSARGALNMMTVNTVQTSDNPRRTTSSD